MAYVTATPDLLVAVAADLEGIGSAINTANAAAAGPTSGVVAAAGDEVSAATATLFNSYAQDYQAAIKQAAAFHDEFTQAMATAGSAYAQAEAAAEAALASGTANALGALNAPIQTLLGHPAISTGGASANSALTSMMKLASGDPLTALIMGGTGDPLPDSGYIAEVNASYIQHLFPGAIPTAMTTPEQMWPKTPQLGNLTFGQSVALGVTALNKGIFEQFGAGNSVVVLGYSQSATVATDEITALMAMGSPHANQLAFVLIGDLNNPDGGILERFPGFYIPFLDIAFNGATPPNSPYPTFIYTTQYDSIADTPRYPLDIFADLNAVLAVPVHTSYPTLTPAQVSNAIPLPTSPGYTGNTSYYMFLTQQLPLLDPIRSIPYVGTPLADFLQPDARVLVDMGYSGMGYGGDYPNLPTPASLIDPINPVTVGFDLAKGTVQGTQAALVDIGLLPQSALPDTYPYVPSLDPGVTLNLGQPSVTGLSLLTGAVGPILELIPPGPPGI